MLAARLFGRLFSRRRDGAALLDPALVRCWNEHGYAILPQFYGAPELDAVDHEVSAFWDRRAPRIVVDDMVMGQRLRLADVDDHARHAHRFKVNDLFLESPAVRYLALNDRITPILTTLLGQVPVLCNSLSFERGSEQPDHVDALYMTPHTPHHLIAIWVAMEDCHPDAGPLRYYPGSHRIPPYVFSNGSHHFLPDEMPLWSQHMSDQIRERELVAQTFAARKGDVFIWSAYLLHGGSPIADSARTRRSIVFHYFSEPDVRSLGCTAIPEGDAFWMHRRHQDVPGQEPSEAPPLP